jgi:oligoendopeptidase F
MKQIIKTSLLFLVIILLFGNLNAQTRERSEVPDKYKWDLSVLYGSTEAWQQAKDKLAEKVEMLDDNKGKLNESAETLYSTIDLYFDALKDFYKLSVYANRLYDEDLRKSENQELTQQISNLGTTFSEKTSYLNPEILQIEPETIEKFYNDFPALKDYALFIDDILRLRDHTLSPDQEQILASAGQVTGNPTTVYNIFDNAEKPLPKVKLSTGEEVELSASMFVKYRTAQNREDRAKVFDAVFNNYGEFENTIGANLAGKIKGDVFYSKNRKYNSALEMSLAGPNIPVSVYTNLIDQINKNLPTLHRFLDLKKRMLGVDELHYYDLYTSIVKEVDLQFSVDEAQQMLLDVFKPMGEEYVKTVKMAFENRWIDFYPTPGKRSGAYSSGAAYDEHPYILMNWNDDYNALSTLAHELGHTMHSYFSNKTQPFQYSDYATFVAEIASTMNENLLNDYMVKNAKTDEEKLFILGSYLELLRTTIFRQTSFAEFEWEIHKKIENGEPLTGEKMSDIYWDIVKRYYGHDEGVMVVDDYIRYEWAYIPHFINYTYYVYQYSTSLIYATAFAEKVKSEGQPAVEKFYEILKGGSSDYPINLIKKAGIDPLSSEAFDLTMKRMNDVMDQIEAILDKK